MWHHSTHRCQHLPPPSPPVFVMDQFPQPLSAATDPSSSNTNVLCKKRRATVVDNCRSSHGRTVTTHEFSAPWLTLKIH
ncbi:hypothetical protein TanjilG_21780 [Lupinus angustifolius]|uniref:Uncharacterized protein n=1 Tax=Lupinus angustifolius TaxID=3871 RepID=A0A1J7HS32_LUPAN|nr:hypothetical protein TanjilG_21780 [Lupinus angustifolius]